MKVVIDNKIPYIREAMEALADEVVYLPGKEITASVVRDADALITRTLPSATGSCWKEAR